MIEGTYELELTCDAAPCSRKQTFSDTSRMQAIATARYDGWTIARDGKRAFCPPHAEERRQNRNRDPK